MINTINKTSPLPARFDVYLKFNTQISSLPSEFDEVSCLEYLNICHRFSLLEALSVEAIGLWLGLDLHDDGIQDGIDVDDCVGVALGYVADRVGIAVGCFYSLWLLLKGRPESQRSAYLSALRSLFVMPLSKHSMHGHVVVSTSKGGMGASPVA